MGNFKRFGLSDDLNALVEVLSVQIHQICGLVLLEATREIALVIDPGLVGLGQPLIVIFRLRVLRVTILPLDGRQLGQRLPLVGDEVGLGDLECSGADPVKGEGRVGLDGFRSEEIVVAVAPRFVDFGGQCLNIVLLLLLAGLAGEDGG